MSAQTLERGTWPGRRWGLLVALVFTGQLTFIFGLSDRAPHLQRPPAKAPTLRFVGDSSSELLALLDPTLFALPHRKGFSAPAWRIRPPSETRSVSPPEAPEYLALALPPPGAGFDRFVAANRFASSLARREPAPAIPLPALFSSPIPTAPSTVRVQGSLAKRPLLKALVVPSWPFTEMLSNTIVQIAVDASGRAISPGALLAGSGSKEADRAALQLARAALFEPVAGSGPPTFGQLIFEWQTLPVTPTNSTVPTP